MTQENKKNADAAEVPQEGVQTDQKNTAEAPADVAQETPAKGSETVRESAAQRVAREVFRSHPDRPAIYVTSDGTSFFNRCDAVNYGRTLKDTTVVEVTNQKNKA